MIDDAPPEVLEDLFEQAPCGYVTVALDGLLLRCNATFLTLSGYARDELVGRRRLQDLLTLPGRIYYETHLGPLLGMQGFVRDVSLDVVCKDERRLPLIVHAAVVKDAAQVPLAIRVTLCDATDRRRYERELIEARRDAERLAQIVEAANDAIISFKPDGEIVTWNAGAERLFGYTRAEAIGASLDALIVPEDRHGEHHMNRDALARGRDVAVETTRRHKSGRLLVVSARATPHVAALGEVEHISAIIRDVTEQRRLEAQVRHAEQLRVVGTLAAGVAHEINNQMTVVIGFGEMVKLGIGQTSPLGADVAAMIDAAERSAGISRQLLAYARQQFITPLSLDLGDVILRARPALVRILGARATLEVEAHETLAAKVDVAQLGEVLRIVVTNALEAFAATGHVHITLREVELGLGDKALFPTDELVPGHYAEIAVHDNGRGMDAVTRARAFEPFFTTKPFGQSRGLGLAMAHGIVRQHEGQMRIESVPGQGTTVRIYLPITTRSGPTTG